MTAPPRNPALVHDWLTGMRGGEKVLEAVGEIFPTATVYTLLHFPGTVSQAIESHPIQTSFLQSAPFVRQGYRNYLGLFPTAIESHDLTAHDLVVSTSHCVAKGVVPGPEAFHLCYCFTPMRYAWDQEHVYFPKRRGLKARFRGLVLSRLRIWDASTAARVDCFVTISRYVARRIRRFYGRSATIVHPPVDTDFFTPGPEEATVSDYCLAVAALVPYKRLDLAIAACEQSGIDLKIVGVGPDRRRLERLAGPRTSFLGRVDDERLRQLYRRARCFVQPGLEDFGISSVEALACGTPIVALGRGGVVDIARDGDHGVLHESPDDPRALSAAIDRALGIRFNKAELRRQAEGFAAQEFRHRFQNALAQRFEEGTSA